MNRQEVLRGVVEVFLEETSLAPEEINADTPILDLDLDSVDYMKIMLGVESRFGFEFRNEDLNLEEYGTLARFADFVAGHYLSTPNEKYGGEQSRQPATPKWEYDGQATNEENEDGAGVHG